jgi:dimethylargininase
VEVRGALHLKSAATRVGRDTVLLNPEWIDKALFDGNVIEVDPGEPFAANVLFAGNTLLCSTAFPKTNARLAASGGQAMVDAAAQAPDLANGGASARTPPAPRPLRSAPSIVEIDATELAKAEGALTCCSILLSI